MGWFGPQSGACSCCGGGGGGTCPQFSACNLYDTTTETSSPFSGYRVTITGVSDGPSNCGIDCTEINVSELIACTITSGGAFFAELFCISATSETWVTWGVRRVVVQTNVAYGFINNTNVDITLLTYVYPFGLPPGPASITEKRTIKRYNLGECVDGDGTHPIRTTDVTVVSDTTFTSGNNPAILAKWGCDIDSAVIDLDYEV